MRAGVAAMAVAAAMALGGCGGSGGGKDDATATPSATGQPDSPSVSPPANASAEPATTTAPGPGASSTDSGQTAGATDTVEGVWLAAEGATNVQLVLGAGKAGLTSTHLCGGTYTGKDAIAITLTCMDGDTQRTTGRGRLSADAKTLTVTWTDGPTDVFARTGLPSD
ncbi:hypothetical protein [Streptomyces sp. NPDC020983]|uniref:hypothetical protein n=1 Tax=Streptomyces sp. NPDC020983 TaxID=3365106 RepID=UPI0037876945